MQNICFPAAKQQVIEAPTTIKKSDMELRKSKNVLKQKQIETQTNDAAYIKDKRMHDNLDIEIKRLTVGYIHKQKLIFGLIF